ncbi:DUF2493 domain-containing protein [Viridibacillus arvi]|uniref:DUF2493 domain-containing protein n=1 Tax=Viridibacillus arvi TaxID=263475 RepID=UPI0034CD66FA
MILIKVVVGGSRGFSDYGLLKSKLDTILKDYEYSQIEIVSGGAEGADKLGERYAEEHGCKLTMFIPDWDMFGGSAGMRRNVEMAHYGDCVICFWDGVSRGTKGMINTCISKSKTVQIIRYSKLNK